MGIFFNASVGCEFSCGSNVHKRHLVPLFAVLVCVEHFFVAEHIRVKVRKAHERIRNSAVAHKQIVVDVGETLTVETCVQAVDNALYAVVVMIVACRVVASLPQRVYLVGCKTEDKDVLVAAFLFHLDICAVKRAYCKRAVYHELHVAGTACLFSGKAYLFAYVSRRH